LSDTEREIPAEYVPTADQRALVENAAAFGRPQWRPFDKVIEEPRKDFIRRLFEVFRA
jgi:hypothetical protein